MSTLKISKHSNVPTALDLVKEEVDKESRRIFSAGGDALKAGNIKPAKEAITYAEKLAEFVKKIQKLGDVRVMAKTIDAMGADKVAALGVLCGGECSGDATWSGNVVDFFFKVAQPICAGIKVPFKIASDNVTRDDDTPIHRSVREVIANALIHADYHGRQGIVIDKYPTRIEVSNPGILRISKAVAVAGGTSDARNAKIFNIFSIVKIGERSGMGLSQLYGNWEEAGYARPQLSESFNPERTKVEIEVEIAEKVAENRSEVAE